MGHRVLMLNAVCAMLPLMRATAAPVGDAIIASRRRSSKFLLVQGDVPWF